MASLAQQALDVATDLVTGLNNGSGVSDKFAHLQLATAVQLLAQSIMGATPSVDVVTPGEVITDAPMTIATQDPQQ